MPETLLNWCRATGADFVYGLAGAEVGAGEYALLPWINPAFEGVRLDWVVGPFAEPEQAAAVGYALMIATDTDQRAELASDRQSLLEQSAVLPDGFNAGAIARAALAVAGWPFEGKPTHV